MKQMYDTNQSFKDYVDKYIAKEGVSLQTALSHAMIRNYADYLVERGGAETVLPNMWGSAGAARENMADI